MQIIVLGTHRSGTSVLTRLLNLMGAHVGEEGLLMRPTDENPRGYWERTDAYTLHQEVLKSVGMDWHGVSQFEFEPGRLSVEQSAAFSAAAQGILSKLDAHRPWVLKDPRLCVMLPLWQEWLEVPIYVHTWRSPLEVAQSLRTWKGLPLQFGIALWEQYNLAALRHTRGFPRLLVSYQDLMQRPVPTVRTLYTDLVALGVPGLRCPGKPELKSWIDPVLYRERAKAQHQKQYINQAQAKLLRGLKKRRVLQWKSLPALSARSRNVLAEYKAWEVRQAEALAVFEARIAEKEARLVEKEACRAGEVQALEKRLAASEARRAGEVQALEKRRAGEVQALEKRRAASEARRTGEVQALEKRLAASEARRAGEVQALEKRLATSEARRVKQAITEREAVIIPAQRPNSFARGYCAVSRGELAACILAAREHQDKIPILFDPAFYLESNEDVKDTGDNPLEHYLQWGAFEGRMPLGDILSDKLHPLVRDLHRLDLSSEKASAFDRDAYRFLNPDLASFDDGTLVEHYEQHGRAELRPCSRRAFLEQICSDPKEIPLDFDPDEYVELHLTDLGSFKGRPLEALHHYMCNGRWESRYYSPRALREAKQGVGRTEEVASLAVTWAVAERDGRAVKAQPTAEAAFPNLYIEEAADSIERETLPVKLIAWYLPQYHTIPENDEWWGKGFTDWVNVTGAKPNYEGHYQPRLPADLGFYDLRVAEVMEQQAALARRYGLYGFCYQYYWFGGKRLLEMPLERMLATGKPDFPFCLEWANENWTRRWDGREHDILIAQQHNDTDDVAVIRDLMRYFRHPNYIRINGKPVLLLYRAGLFPNIRRTVARWREVCRQEGVGDLYLVMMGSFEHGHSAGEVDPARYGLEAIVEYPPHEVFALTNTPGRVCNPNYAGRTMDYSEIARIYQDTPIPAHITKFRGLIPDWDNTARRQNDPLILHNGGPHVYQEWLETIIEQTCERYSGDERLVFINAWNEWAEGAYLEPDRKYGFAYLAATRAALEQVEVRRSVPLLLAREGIATSTEPVVSVVIPVYGQLSYTLQCLSSIASSLPSVPFEIIVVDDGSPDNSVEVLRSIAGIRLISRSKNQGFIRACNAGARAAKGEYLCFLNNDTEVKPGWLEELVRTFREFPGTGLVGSKLIYPDGVLQEAGGLIWQDGSAANFGRDQDASLPVYNYAREVDYCSAASIMVPRSLFEEDLGGFDERYLPSYCEDSDLALKIRARGHRVIYQPLSVVVHHEGISYGRNTTPTTPKTIYQTRNTKKLYERWHHHLAHHQAPGLDLDAAKDRMAKHRVLVLEHATPVPDRDAASVTTLNTMLLLREMGFQVTFIAEHTSTSEYTVALQRVGIETPDCPSHEAIEKYVEEGGGRYDLVIVCRVEAAEKYENLATLRRLCPRAKVLFWVMDLFHLRISRQAKILADEAIEREAVRLEGAELASIRTADGTVVHSPVEHDLISRKAPEARIHVVPLILDTPGTSRTFSDRQGIVFLGGYGHPPNVDAVQYFVKDLMPGVRRRLPGVRFHIAGSNVPEEFEQYKRETDIVITGHVDDLQPLFDQIRVFVAPLRYGAGVKGKIGTAMSAGLPVVATSIAAEGMGLTDGRNILIADEPEAFADTLARLYNNEALWTQLSEAGLEFARKTWGAETAWTTLSTVLSDLGFSDIERGSHPLQLYSPWASVHTNKDTE